MDLTEFYTVRSPVVWASLPLTLSHSSLLRIKLCPLRYQLERSEFPKIGRFPTRPNSAALEGAIVHACLEALFKAFSLAGFPDLGGETARDCARNVGLTELIQSKLDENSNQLKGHPRGAGCKLHTSASNLANRIIRLFRQQYLSIDRTSGQFDAKKITISRAQPDLSDLKGWLASAGALTELTLRHPELAFEGVIDLICCRDGETVIVDYKSGAQDSEHRIQVMRYAVLWWRASGQLPDQIEIQYLTEKWSEHVKEAVMMQMENELRREIDAASVTLASPPAKSCPGDHCGYCDVRQFCDDYWQDTASMHRSRGGFVDVQLAVNGEIAAHGFSATTASGSAVKVTSSSDVGKLQFRGLISGDSLRIIGARFESRNNEYYLSASAEIWRLLPYTPI